MAEDGILRIRHVQVGVDQLVEQIFGKSLVNRKIVWLAGQFRVCPLAGHDGECWNRGKEKSLHVVVANHDRHVRLGLVQVLAKQTHRGDVRIKLSEVFTWWPDKKLRRVYRSKCRYDFPHVSYL